MFELTGGIVSIQLPGEAGLARGSKVAPREGLQHKGIVWHYVDLTCL